MRPTQVNVCSHLSDGDGVSVYVRPDGAVTDCGMTMMRLSMHGEPDELAVALVAARHGVRLEPGEAVSSEKGEAGVLAQVAFQLAADDLAAAITKPRAEERRYVAPEPPPVATEGRPIWDLVIEDMRARDADGRRKYGTPLQAGNGRDPLVDAYQEALDLAVYLRQAIDERDLISGGKK